MFSFCLTLFFFHCINGKWLSPPYSYPDYYYGYNDSYTEPDVYTQSYDYDNYTSRIRYLKAIEVNVNITIDIQLSIPLGDAGSIDLEIPITILIQNKTVFKLPYPDPPVKVPLFYPVIKLPKLPSFLHPKQQYQQQQSYSDYSSDQALYDYYSHPKHQLAKRSLAAQSTVHRFEIFNSIEKSLDKQGYTGRTCLLRAICQLAQMDLLIESVFHEVVEHLLTVSRGVDEEDLLGDYLQAELYGEKHDDCQRKYPCAFSLFQKL